MILQGLLYFALDGRAYKAWLLNCQMLKSDTKSDLTENICYYKVNFCKVRSQFKSKNVFE